MVNNCSTTPRVCVNCGSSGRYRARRSSVVTPAAQLSERLRSCTEARSIPGESHPREEPNLEIGFFAVGIGPSADPDCLALTARAVEQGGFHSLWTGEHVVLVSQYASKYPYSQDGRMPLPTTKVDFLDPFATVTFAAAHTQTVRLGTGICLVPEHNPVVLAKQVASLDKLSGGRLDFGVGIGWLAEEFAAVGVPWERRADRTREYLKAMKLLWTEEEPQFQGEFCSFPKVCSYPKPVQKPYPPIIFGGKSVPALRRVGEVGDGWFGVNVTPDDAKTKIERRRQYAQAAGRDPDK